MIASKKMKQLQWEKVSKAQLGKTVWGKNEEARLEEEVAEKLKMFNVWDKIEDQFKAKEVMYDAISKSFFPMYGCRMLMSNTEKRKEQQIISVLAPDHRKRIGKSNLADTL